MCGLTKEYCEEKSGEGEAELGEERGLFCTGQPRRPLIARRGCGGL